mgnify:CR=1 FL=1
MQQDSNQDIQNVINIKKNVENKIFLNEQKAEKKTKIQKNLFNYSIVHQNSINIFGIQKSQSFKLSSTKFQILKKIKTYSIRKILDFSIYSSKDEFEKDHLFFFSKIKPKGLRNLGGCCYMNATLQCFYHIREFSNFFMKNKKEIIIKDGLLTTGLLDVIEGLSRKDSFSCYSPKKFKNNLIEVDDVFEGSEGKDSGDLVQTILTVCQDELGGEPELPDFSIDAKDECALFLDLYYKNSQVNTIIMELFNFYLRIRSRCFGCGTVFYNILSENMLMLDLKQAFILNEKDKDEKLIGQKKCVSVDECLAYYSFDGAIRDNSFCKYCKKNTSIFSIRSFITLPKYLIMVMSRGEKENFECDVDFKEDIDLKQSYYKLKCIPHEKNTKYILFAGTILYGSQGYGHTVAFCKHFDNQFYIFNDSTFTKTSFSEIKKQKIYLLFYQKAS